MTGQQIDVTLARDDSGNMSLTHATGDNTYESVVLSNGVKQTDGLAKKTGQYKLSAAWNNVSLAASVKEALHEASATFVLRAQGNLKLLKSGEARGGTTNEGDGEFTVTVQWIYDSTETVAGADGITLGHFVFSNTESITFTATEAASLTKAWFAIEPNNTNGNEAQSGTGAAWATDTDYVAGVYVKAEDNKFYVCEANHHSGTWATDLGNGLWSLVNNVGTTAPALHTADGIAIALS